MARTYLVWLNSESKLYTRGIGMFRSIIRTSACTQCQQQTTDSHFNPIVPVTFNGKTKSFMIERFHVCHVFTEENNIIEGMEIHNPHRHFVTSPPVGGGREGVITSINCLSISCQSAARSTHSIRIIWSCSSILS